MNTAPQTAPGGFDPTTATPEALRRYAVPARPDPHAQPGLAALWEQKVRRYREFDHVAVTSSADAATSRPEVGTQAFTLFPREACGFERTSFGQPFTSLFLTMTVPNLRHTPSPHGTVLFRTFAGLGFLDVHVEMTVNAAGTVTSLVTAPGIGAGDLPVHPGDVLSISLCLDTGPKGRANITLANETSRQTANASFDSFLPPAVIINAGVSRGDASAPQNPLAPFGDRLLRRDLGLRHRRVPVAARRGSGHHGRRWQGPGAAAADRRLRLPGHSRRRVSRTRRLPSISDLSRRGCRVSTSAITPASR